MLGRTVITAILLGPAAASYAAAQGPFVSSVTLRGSSAFEPGEVLSSAGLAAGANWSEETAAMNRDIITSLYRSRGFMDAAVSVSGLASGTSVHVTIEVTEGRRYVFGETRFSGLKKLRPATAAKELSYAPGAPYDQQELLNSQSRLYASNWFESVRTRTATSTAGTVDVDVEAAEQPLKWVKGGIGYGSEEKERLSLGFTHNNFLDRGYKLEVNGMLSRIWLEYRADFTNRHFFDSLTEFRDSNSWRRERRDGYDMESVKNTLSFGRKLTASIYGSVQYRMQRTLIYDVAPGISAETPSLSRIRAAGVSFNRDTTDDFFYPSRGLRSELTFERSGGIWGGDINIYKASLRNTFHKRLSGIFTGLLSARWAFVHETDGTPDVPVYERLFIGGANSIRGYAERGVGPSDADGNPLGGKVLLGAGAELRFPIYRKFRGALFTEGGQVADSLKGAAPRRWKYGAGAGLRYRTPVGPIRADFGYKLNPDKPARADLWRLHLSIGEAF